ncbi:MAG: hypothetical protein N2313_06100 [Meiothermus ruber]|nr:hypothetical protein [Meiothermus ruber]
MSRKAAQTPVFLVNPDQMDVLSPPSRSRGLDPEKVKEWAARRNEAENRDDDPLRGLDELRTDWSQVFVAAGLYMSKPPAPQDASDVLAKNDADSTVAAEVFRSLEGPSIYLCCERINKWAKKANVRLELAMAKVLYHELGHAMMDTGPGFYHTDWGKIIEESLANWLAVSCFKGSERVAAQRLIRHQPAEYLGYVAVNEEALFELRLVRRLGRRMPPFLGWIEDFLPEVLWHLRHGHLAPLGMLVGDWNLHLWQASKRTKLLCDPHVQRTWAHVAEHFLIRGCE